MIATLRNLKLKKTETLAIAAALTATTLGTVMPAHAQSVPADVTTAISDVGATMEAVAGVALAVLAAALTVIGITAAVKAGKKVMSRG